MPRPKSWTRVLLAATLIATALALLQSPASAGAAHGTGVTAPASARVATDIDGEIVITNQSSAPENSGVHTISDIFLTPSCGSPTPTASGDCSAPDVGVLVVTSAQGVAGTACAGIAYSAVGPTSTGRYELVGSSPTVLAPPTNGGGAECRINLDLYVRSVPTIDALPSGGLQTIAMVSSRGASSATSTTSFAAGTRPITIEQASPGVTTQVVDADVALGEPVGDAATLAGGAHPTGEIAFDLYGPDDEACASEPAATLTSPVDGAGTYTSPTTLPEAPGSYRFVARYSGDADNLPTSGACDDPNESVVVAAAEPPGIRVVKQATPLSRPEPGGTFSFAVEVTNTSAVPLTITGLDDDVYGDVATKGTCTSAVSTVLEPGDTYRCAFPGDLAGNAGATQTDLVTASAVDGQGTTVLDEDDATVSLTDVPPTITVAKTALPTERVAPGGLFTFGVVVTNTSFEPVTITKLVDDVYGDLTRLTSDTCATAVGKTLVPAGQLSCTFTGQLTGAAGRAQTDVVTVTVTDDDGSTGSAHDDATIRLLAPGETPATTTTTAASAATSSTSAASTSTSPSSTTPPSTTSAPTTARPGTPSLARTGAPLRTAAALGLGLVGAGMLLTGFGWTLPLRRRRGPGAPPIA